MTSIDKFFDFINENSQIRFSFSYDGKKISFQEKTKKSIFAKVIDWISQNGYKFENKTGQSYYPNIVNSIPSGHRISHYHKIPNTNKFVDINFIKQFQGLTSLLIDFGVKKESIQFDNQTEVIDDETTKEETSTESYSENPFKQAICVLGDPGVGKSYTIREILRKDKHIFQIIEPTATTTNLLAQFSPNKGGYVPSRLGNLLIEASKHPDKLYTAIIDEFHKSNVIDMVNDELKHAISTKRYGGDRFILSDDSNDYLKSFLDEDDGGNLIVPDNFGFIFLSSKPDIVINNGDIFDRLDIVNLRHHKEENIKSVSDLINRASQSDIEKKHLLNKK